ncbi:phosphoglycerate mutase [Nitrosomonas sp.]|uniref:phosphoglycerate mutase n=1 Tax=Nitrosomonas sp. TaxID=42353 RepID=UPI001DAA85DC|nr:phosphoglycerate mutase [Nitrosomonas sp.]MBX3615666.1 phosphoglycerate mutase [Nitrosomonas sp.]
MKLHLLIPQLFWPEKLQPEIYQALPAPYLSKLLSKSRFVVESAEDMESWLCKQFNIAEQQHNWPIAPLMLHIDAPDMSKSNKDFWLRADPVHLRIEQNHIMLADSQAFQISQQEAEEIVDSINRNLGDQEFSLIPFHPDRWYIRMPKIPDVHTYTLDQVTCKNINRYLPSGRDSTRWHKLFNEIQMLLHDHPINQARASRGELTINSVWFWGGGQAPQSISSSFTHIHSDHDLPRALALATQTNSSGLPGNPSEWMQIPHSGTHLIVLDALQSKAKYRNGYDWRETLMTLEQQWFSSIYRALKEKRINQLIITALNETGSRNFIIEPVDLWKFWRLNQPLMTHSNKH